MKMDQYKTPLFDAIKNYIDDDITPFHIPSHKMGAGVNPKWKDFVGEQIFKMDICEVHGLDDIHQPEGVIQESQMLAADAWGADQSFFLVNGTSGGIISSICTIASEGEKIIVPRNAHKSVVFALIISGAKPIYISAEIYKEKGIVGGFDPNKLRLIYEKNKDAKGVFSVSPTYHGVCSDMKSLIDITHNYGGTFIADEAHGNHVYFNEKLSKGALEFGADISCQSIHKMCGSLTQSSMLHTKGNKVDLKKLKFNLQMMMNTSPSYLLEVSLDLARSYVATVGHDILDELIDLASMARQRIQQIPGIEILGDEVVGNAAIADYDPIRLIISARNLGIEGYELYEILRNDYKIEAEFGDYFYVLCIMGLGTKKEHVLKLVDALKDISRKHVRAIKHLTWEEELPPIPHMFMSPRDAYFRESEKIPWREAKGRISAEMIVPYPPGIPTICPGEIVTDEVWDFLNNQKEKGRHLHGPEGGVLNELSIVKGE